MIYHEVRRIVRSVYVVGVNWTVLCLCGSCMTFSAVSAERIQVSDEKTAVRLKGVIIPEFRLVDASSSSAITWWLYAAQYPGFAPLLEQIPASPGMIEYRASLQYIKLNATVLDPDSGNEFRQPKVEDSGHLVSCLLTNVSVFDALESLMEITDGHAEIGNETVVIRIPLNEVFLLPPPRPPPDKTTAYEALFGDAN